MTRNIAQVWVLLVLLVACTSVGNPGPETFNERLAASIVTVTGIRATATSLLKQGRISADDAQNVQAQADAARAGLDIARKIHATDPAAGQARLIAAATALQALQLYLQTRSEK